MATVAKPVSPILFLFLLSVVSSSLAVFHLSPLLVSAFLFSRVAVYIMLPVGYTRASCALARARALPMPAALTSTVEVDGVYE